MVVVVIIAIATTLGIPSYRAWMQNTQIYNAAESAESGLQKAKAEAVRQNTNVEFVLSANPLTHLLTNNPWKIQVAGSGVIETSASEGSKNVTAIVTPSNAADSNGFSTVTFNNFGGVATSNANGTVPLTKIDFNSAVLPTSSRNLRVTIGLGGITRMCDPNLASGSSPRAC